MCVGCGERKREGGREGEGLREGEREGGREGEREGGRGMEEGRGKQHYNMPYPWPQTRCFTGTVTVCKEIPPPPHRLPEALSVLLWAGPMSQIKFNFWLLFFKF